MQRCLAQCGSVIACLSAAAFAAGGLAAAAQPPRPNILLMISDDQRPDTIRALGNTHIQTPNLDRLAAGGTALTRAICTYPLCYPSRAEILTGTTVFRNGIQARNRLDPGAVTLPATLRAAGYRTAHVGKWHIAGRPADRGYEMTDGMFSPGKTPPEKQVDSFGREVTGYRGWMFHDEEGRPLPEKGVGLTPNISAEFADAAIRLIRRKDDAGRPFFIHVNFTAPHDPLLTPPGFEAGYRPEDIPLPPNFLPEHPFDHGNLRGRDELLWPWPRTEAAVRAELALYYAVISHLDREIGRILDALDETLQAANTVVIFTSDNGLAVGSHGLHGKQNMYEHSIGVPLVFRGPGVVPGRRSAAACHLRDIFPTLCELAGIPVPASVEASSLAAVLRGDAETVHPFLVGYFGNTQRMIRTAQWKYIRYPQIGREQLFDLRGDPGEMRDLSADAAHAETLSRLRKDLAEWLCRHGDPLDAGTPARE